MRALILLLTPFAREPQRFVNAAGVKYHDSMDHECAPLLPNYLPQVGTHSRRRRQATCTGRTP